MKQSSITINPIDITYLTCLKGGLHEGEVLNRICIDHKCNQRNLICTICDHQAHKKHQTIPVKQFINILINQCNNNVENPLRNIQDIQKHRENVENTIALKKIQVIQEFQKLENQCTRFFDEIEQFGLRLIGIKNPIQRVIENMCSDKNEGLENLTNAINQILEVIKLEGNEHNSIDQTLEGIIIDANERSKKAIQSVNNIVTSLKTTFDKISDAFEKPIQLYSSGFQWSQVYKGAKIKIQDKIAQQTGMQSSGQRFILMNKNLNLNNKVKQWGIKIKSFGGWIGIGISSKKKITQANYNFHYTTLGHGSYLISTNGYSWSHSAKQFNSALKCFAFNVGDIIYIKYNPVTKKLKFTKNQSTLPKDSFELDIQQPLQNDGYYPCANMCGLKDSVQIVSYAEPLF